MITMGMLLGELAHNYHLYFGNTGLGYESLLNMQLLDFYGSDLGPRSTFSNIGVKNLFFLKISSCVYNFKINKKKI